MTDSEKQNGQEEPKIIVDDDWKTQAKAEKEKLAKEVEDSQAAGPGAAGGPEQGPRELPAATFVTLVNSLVTQVLIALAGYEDPKTKRRYVDLDLAKHFIDTLAVLEEKTGGNLTDEEKKLLDRGLYETRLQYVQVAQAAQAVPGPVIGSAGEG